MVHAKGKLQKLWDPPYLWTCRKGRLQLVAEGLRLRVRGLVFLMSGQLQVLSENASLDMSSIHGGTFQDDSACPGYTLPLTLQEVWCQQ